jgi:predicted amidohydrolase YtcJ
MVRRECRVDAASGWGLRRRALPDGVPVRPGQGGRVAGDAAAVITHSQFVRKDQLDSYKQYGVIPSFFTNHAYMFGDAHVENLGKERAFFLSPLKTAASKGLIVTNHTDYASSPPAPLFAIWTAVNRVSRSGAVIGPDERVTPYEALRATTANGAYMYFEEGTKGSLQVGKRADLVLLDGNPLSVAPSTLKDIKVVETIKDGKTVFVAP